MIPNTIVKLTANRQLSVMIVNSTNKSFTVKRDAQLARIQAVPDATISSLDKNKTNWKNKPTRTSDKKTNCFENVDVPTHT